jgi:hypothetical protein
MLGRYRVYRRQHPLWRVPRQFLQSCLGIRWKILAKLPDHAIREVIRPESTNSLQGNTLGSPRSQQGPRSRVPELDDLVSDFDLPRTAVDQIYNLRGNLRGKTERVRCPRRCRLQTITRLICDSPCDGIGVRRERTERWVVLRDIVDTSRDSPDLACFGQSAQCLVHGGAVTQVGERFGCERRSHARSSRAGQHLQRKISHVRNIISYS